MDDLKRITILHSNDIHGKFTGETGEDGKLRHSMAQVAGFVAETKKNNPNTLYCIAGDVFQGSLIDFDFDSKELSVEFDGKPLEDDRMLEMGMQEYYLINSENGLGIRPEELVAEEDGIWIASPDGFLTLQDYFSGHQDLGGSMDDRCVIRGNVGGFALEVEKRRKQE